MTTYTHPFPLKSYERVKSFVQSYMDQFSDSMFIVKGIKLPIDILDELNAELASYNLPPVNRFLAFKRRGMVTPKKDKVHLDYSEEIKGVCYASLIVPISGCQNSFMYWYEGKYTKDKQVTLQIEGKHDYQIIEWDSEPTMVYKEEITEPTLCRVDVPHSACSNPDGSYRTIISLRFKGNPTFDEIVQKRFDNKSQL